MKHTILAILLLAHAALLAQTDTTRKDWEWGVGAAFSYQIIRAEKFNGFSQTVTDNYEVEGIGGMAMSGGFVVLRHLNDSWTLKPQLYGVLSNARVRYKFTTEPAHTYQVYPLSVELAVMAEKVFGQGIRRPTVSFGGGMDYLIEPLGSQVLVLKPYDFVARFGVGLKNQARKSTWSVDLLFSIGLRQLAENEGSIYNQSTGLLQRNAVGLYFSFY
ncbi:MAG: hypothetical protein KDC12_14500 [Flavobacteriales bacterium]|nr:hypothetical protein [Flavobacteriales bacterium]